MTRIVGGQARGRRLTVPPRGTRPTSEQVREALFNTLQSHLQITGTRVLDLFAGSGAVGLEALSRGASAAEFVESDQTACQILRGNIAAVGLPGAVLHRVPVAAYVTQATAERSGAFDLVFLDPPYAAGEQSLTALLTELAGPGWLTNGALVVVERSAGGPAHIWPRGLAALKSRRYGGTVLWYGRRS
jgi:16S rRNA (guanine966-N2)-methyltransferase